MQGRVPLVDAGETAGDYHVMSGSGSMGAGRGQQAQAQPQMQANGSSIIIGGHRVTYADILLVLATLQTVSLLLNLYSEVSG